MKNNRIIIILIIIVILLLAYIVFKPKAVVAPLQQEVSKEVVKDKVVEMKNYENKELGFSFSYPEKYGEIKTYNNLPIVNPGETGYHFNGSISMYPNPFFYFTSMTKDYTAGRDMDCGESKSTYKEIALLYKESLNSKGERYVFNVKTDNDGMPPAHQVAFFEMKGQYPLLGFCASLDIPKADFLQVMDSVDIK